MQNTDFVSAKKIATTKHRYSIETQLQTRISDSNPDTKQFYEIHHVQDIHVCVCIQGSPISSVHEQNPPQTHVHMHHRHTTIHPGAKTTFTQKTLNAKCASVKSRTKKCLRTSFQHKSLPGGAHSVALPRSPKYQTGRHHRACREFPET